MKKRLILPTEVKVCATCSYWDGERQVDEEFQVVVLSETATGECLVQETDKLGLHDTRCEPDCVWEHLEADTPAADDKPASRVGATGLGSEREAEA